MKFSNKLQKHLSFVFLHTVGAVDCDSRFFRFNNKERFEFWLSLSNLV